MKNFYVFLALMFIVLPVNAIELESAFKADGSKSISSEEQRNAAMTLSQVIFDQYSRDETGIALAYTNLDSGSEWYALFDSNKIFGVDVDQGRMIGHWPLTRWEGEYLEEEVKDRYTRYGGDLPDPSLPNRSYLRRYDPEPLGCLTFSPLRYGDFTGDGSNELVFFLWNELLVFDPDHDQLIFGTMLRVHDWFNEGRTEGYIDRHGGPMEDSPQYQSQVAAGQVGTIQGEHLPGLRGYGKLFFGDFNEDEMTDLVVWRKLYVSREQSESVMGFRHLGDTLLHYQLEDGEYKRQTTEEPVMREWLSERNLTWPKGYPSYSECDGEEGQLIPEMHDPLLNDPDVLEGVDPETMTFIEDGEG